MKLRRYKKTDLRGIQRVVMRVDLDFVVEPYDWRDTVGMRGLLGVSRKYPRIDVALDEIRDLVGAGIVIVLIGHYGRPKGSVDATLSLKWHAQYVERRLNRNVVFTTNIKQASEQVERFLRGGEGGVIMLENLRFWKEEEMNGVRFARALAELGDAYINNAFSVSHRKHASISAITRYLPCYAGEALVNEVQQLKRKRAQPLAVVLGGVKLATKMPLLIAMQEEIDYLIVGSGLAVVFDVAKGGALRMVGRTTTDEEIALAHLLIKTYGQRIILPASVVVKNHGHVRQRELQHANGEVLDIGSDAFSVYDHVFSLARTIIWNGPLGRVEEREGMSGTRDLLKKLNALTDKHVIIGGGDTITAVERLGGARNHVTVSQGGGAMLAFLAGEKMPGLEALI